MITARGMWVPGELLPTNAALHQMRAAGFHAGAGRYRPRLSQTLALRNASDHYAGAARTVRRRVADAARLRGWGEVPQDARVRLRFSVHGYPRWDAAGAMLPAKWAEDGLVDAGVLRSDRYDTVAIEVTVCRDFDTVATKGPGIYVAVEW